MEYTKIKNRVKPGDIICYRPNLVRVLTVEEDGCWIRGPYGEEQKIDLEDVDLYNPRLKDESDEESDEGHPQSFSQYLNNLFQGVFR